MKGGLVVFAAGNSDSDSFCSNYDKMFTVTSVGPDFRRAYYSNYGPAAKADITGCWELTGITTKSAVIGDQTVDVYLKFDSGNFEIYQRTGTTDRYYRFEGTYTFDGSNLSGEYSDKRKWSTTYVVAVSNNELSLTSGVETDTYKKIDSIPSGLKY